jgi:hypothetical protein
MVSSDWPDLEYLVIRIGVRVLRVNEALDRVVAAVEALDEANDALSAPPTEADVETLAARYAAQVAPLEEAAQVLEAEMPEIGPGHDQILDLVDDEREATGVAEEYLGGIVHLGASCGRVHERVGVSLRAIEARAWNVPAIQGSVDDLASSMRRLLVALEPARGWAERSAAILADSD